MPLSESIESFFAREVKPHVADAWIDANRTDPQDGEVGLVGYEINFNRYFYVYRPPRPLEEIEADIQRVEKEIVAMRSYGRDSCTGLNEVACPAEIGFSESATARGGTP